MILKCSKCNQVLIFSFKDNTFFVDRCACSFKWDAYMEGLNDRVEECISRLETRYCWYRMKTEGPLIQGIYHRWDQNYEEFETGPGVLSVAIIEDALTHECHTVNAQHVSFDDTFNEQPKPLRFQPRLESIEARWYAIQVHPEVIELFSYNLRYQCQVRWDTYPYIGNHVQEDEYMKTRKEIINGSVGALKAYYNHYSDEPLEDTIPYHIRNIMEEDVPSEITTTKWNNSIAETY